MFIRQESLPKANIYSSKTLFDQMEDRNTKRMNQILRRKKALSTRNKDIKFEEEKSNLSPEKEKEKTNLINININTLNQFNKSIYNYNFIKDNNISKIDEIKVFSNSNEINNSSTNPNSSILNRDSQEKEITNSIIEEEVKEAKETNKNDKIINSNIYNYKDNKSIINIDVINCDLFNDENDSKEFKLKYLSSSLDSFIKLDNHLITRVKQQNNCFTESYSQALELNYDDNFTKNGKNIFQKNYLVTEIIKEEKEKEEETPLKINKNKERNNYRNKNKCEISNEEQEMINRIARRRAYSKRIRNNLLNKNIKDVFESNNNNKTKIIDKTLNTSKSCKKLRQNNNINLAREKCYCQNKNNNKNFERKIKFENTNSINFGRKTICNFKKNNLNNSFNLFNKNDKNKKQNNNNSNKILKKINSTTNINNKKICTSRSNINIFKNDIFQKKTMNTKISMNNFCTKKVIRKNKLQSSKSAKRFNDISKNSYLNDKYNNIFDKNRESFKINNSKNLNTNNKNNNRILKKNPTMGRLTTINLPKKENISNISTNNNLNKTKSFRTKNSFLNNTMSFRDIKNKKPFINSTINSRNSMPFQKKSKKIVNKILITENNKKSKKLVLNKSYCNLDIIDKSS